MPAPYSHDDDDVWNRLDWNDVRVFLAVAESGSLSAATRLLGMSQPTISRRIEDMELRLGAQLFRRSSRGVQLTEAGETARDLAAGMARLGGALVREISGSDKSETGRVILRVPDVVLSEFLAPNIAEFYSKNPEIDLVFDTDDRRAYSVYSEDDIRLDFEDSDGSGFSSRSVATLHFILTASRNYLALYGGAKSLVDVANHRFVRCGSPMSQRSTLDRRYEAALELLGTSAIVPSIGGVLACVKNSAGVGLLPTAVLATHPELVPVIEQPFWRPTLWLRVSDSRVGKRRVSRVVDWLSIVFDENSSPWFRKDYVAPSKFEASLGRTSDSTAYDLRRA